MDGDLNLSINLGETRASMSSVSSLEATQLPIMEIELLVHEGVSGYL